MKYYINSSHRQKKNILLIVLITITLIGFIATAALTSGFFYMNKTIGQNQKSIEETKQATADLRQQITVSKKNSNDYNTKIDTLSEQELRFEPVIIPESMASHKVAEKVSSK